MAGTLTLRLAEDEEPPASALFPCLALGRRTFREARVHGRRFTGDGLSVWPGERLTLSAAYPPGARLRFATVAEAQGREGVGVELTFRVRVDREPVWESRLTVAPAPTVATGSKGSGSTTGTSATSM